MKCVSELYNLHSGQDIYVIGTGASLRVFPTDFLEGKITIGLNMAWKNLPIQYGITIHPDLNVPEFMPNEKPRPEITWITKYNKTKALVSPEQLKYAEENFYFFESYGGKNTQPPGQPSDTGRVLDWVRQPTGDRLYMWSSISQAGVNLAANLGAKNIILIGCDNCALGGNFYAHKQHVQWVGAKPEDRFRQYYEGLAEIRPVLKERGINLISLSPFLSLAHLEEDFEQLCQQRGLPKLIETTGDISKKIPAKEFIKYYVDQLKQMIKTRSTSKL